MTIEINNEETDAIGVRFTQVSQHIEQLTRQYQRAAGDVKLLAVSKTKPLSSIRAAYALGQKAFGENYVQEAVDKYHALSDLTDIEWHFIGPIQSNKSRAIAETMDWVHSVDREKIARRLSEQRGASLPPLNVCIQVNISGEESKSGIPLAELDAMVALVTSLPNLSLRGLMAIPAPQENHAAQCAVYAPLTQAFLALSQSHTSVDTLSIGMSGDLAAAIESGSTLVRVGTAIFGERAHPVNAS
ncbi:YggS family pyridoxal phosphate-dependent enzyme [Marinomonas hwangdonensis]|uniref:Pyridoxal phosphate homeostasis protein n=1 Tax=Marinomonas hwangdonensis TaxID=1053647 RepID=A0A3M8Q2Z4_9GAMM|nr:YggS family pyridoxal phosphate-dependent enzyme [Marinomonas hwangdonensis]RNF50485.1 YggS family pyridoxal phosphate-dependent enzyme [Marinomonas hwangdonensis]